MLAALLSQSRLGSETPNLEIEWIAQRVAFGLVRRSGAPSEGMFQPSIITSTNHTSPSHLAVGWISGDAVGGQDWAIGKSTASRLKINSIDFISLILEYGAAPPPSVEILALRRTRDLIFGRHLESFILGNE
jgi:hypothetical protein